MNDQKVRARWARTSQEA